MKTKTIVLGVCSGMALLPSILNAQIVYSDNFNSGAGDAVNWNINSGPGNNSATFGFDYSTVGIPSAPNSGDGSTIGLKLNANNLVTGQLLTGISVSPISLSVSGDYQLRFDMWANFIGPAPGGGSGSTQITGAGIGTSGTAANYAGAANGIWFAGTGDGNSASDYRVYTPAVPSSLGAGNPVYAAPGGAINNSATAYYTSFYPAHTAPAAQTTLFPSQTGSVAAGAMGWAWHDVTITKIGNSLAWNMDGQLFASLDITTNGVLSGNDFMFVQSDINTTASSDANGTTLNFGLFDNVVVTQIPEPISCALGILGGFGLFLARRRTHKV